MRTGLLQWPGKLNGESLTVERLDSDIFQMLSPCAVSVFLIFPKLCLWRDGDQNLYISFDPKDSGKLPSQMVG